MEYYIGLDIGTDSVGYAVTDRNYTPLKKFGEPMMGITTFEAANTASDRRTFRTARRRIDRKQQRVSLVNEIFAAEIAKIDPRFFIRRNESRLFREETDDAFPVFSDNNYTDKEYYKEYPTIHHLIVDLMQSKEPHDVRLVYLAVSWLVAHRGHFLFDVAPEKAAELLDFETVYKQFCAYFEENEYKLPWSESVSAEAICEILLMHAGVGKKKDAFKQKIFGGKKPAKEKTDACPFGAEAIIALLSGAKVKPEDVFQTGEYTEIESLSLTMGDEDFARIVADLGDDGELIRRMRALQDCALLITAKNNKDTISEAQVDVYNQHKEDLALLKRIIKKYKHSKYNEIFRDGGKSNYTAYSYNTKGCDKVDFKKASKESFDDYIKGIIKNIEPDECDRNIFENLKARIEIGTFMPKQKNTDNRVIPQQLYRIELQRILDNAEGYLTWLGVCDADGLAPKQKLLSIFDFRVPYFVGPLANRNSDHAWIVRKGEGKIYPWNFEQLVDFEESEEQFISRMTNKCSYIAGADVIPAKSLLYSRFTVLNEINNIKVDGVPITPELKQEIYNKVMLHQSKVTLKKIKDYLISTGAHKNSEITGVDVKLTSSLYPYHKLRRLLDAGTISESDAENIIVRAAYSESKSRFIKWISEHYPSISENDCKYIANVDFKNFGRLSRELLTEVPGCKVDTGEYYKNIITAMWETNDNLMQLLSERYTFREEIERRNREYYESHTQSLSKRLDEMYISNSVKRPILRTLDICNDIVKATGCEPAKIFIEMARGANEEQKGKRSQSRKEQLKELYRKIKTEDARILEKELDAMGEMADNKLQSEVLFLYYLQMGKCAYTGEPILLSKIYDSALYNKDHIYPQAFVKDDSILNNKVLVSSKVNGSKKDVFPISPEIQAKMRPIWDMWKSSGLMTDEKYRRLTRTVPFTNEEKWGFINRQLVETRQSTKAVASLLGEKYPNAEIVYVKAGLVSEFRQEFDIVKSRTVNDLHHAKDAYLNIVVGNVYNSRFTRRFFDVSQRYSVKTKTLFDCPVRCGVEIVWNGETDIAKVKRVMQKNHIHVTRYAFIRKGGLYDQQPVKAKAGLVPLKEGLPTEKYGGYNGATVAFYYLAEYTAKNKREIIFVPVKLMIADKCLMDAHFAQNYIKKEIEKNIRNTVSEAKLLLNGRPLKIGTVIEVDGLRLILRGKYDDSNISLGIVTALNISSNAEKYIKRLESFANKAAVNSAILPDEMHDGISKESNIWLYDELIRKLSCRPFSLMPGNKVDLLVTNRDTFITLPITEQVRCLNGVLSLMGNAETADLTMINGSKGMGKKMLSAKLCNWKKKYTSMRIIDQSASGIYETRSENLLDLL